MNGLAIWLALGLTAVNMALTAWIIWSLRRHGLLNARAAKPSLGEGLREEIRAVAAAEVAGELAKVRDRLLDDVAPKLREAERLERLLDEKIQTMGELVGIGFIDGLAEVLREGAAEDGGSGGASGRATRKAEAPGRGSGPESDGLEGGGKPLGGKYEAVYRLALEGKTPLEISRITRLGVGEVQLILGLLSMRARQS